MLEEFPEGQELTFSTDCLIYLMSCIVKTVALLVASSSVVASEGPLTLWLLPHTHADVGWLQTVNSLARVNVSRILSGVVSTLEKNPSRRFVWDEMAFLQHWWEHDATEAERVKFKSFVQARRIAHTVFLA